jgi:hypothetical protein
MTKINNLNYQGGLEDGRIGHYLPALQSSNLPGFAEFDDQKL